MFLKIFSLVALLAASSAYANGGGSSMGTGAPKFEYKCIDQNDQNFQVSIGQFYPKYQDQITVIDGVAKTIESEDVIRHVSPALGSPLQFVGQHYTLNVKATTTPVIIDGEVYSYSELYKDSQLDAITILHLREYS